MQTVLDSISRAGVPAKVLDTLRVRSKLSDLVHLQRMPLPQAAHPLYRVLVPLHDLGFYPGWRLLRASLPGMGVRAKSILTPRT